MAAGRVPPYTLPCAGRELCLGTLPPLGRRLSGGQVGVRQGEGADGAFGFGGVAQLPRLVHHYVLAMHCSGVFFAW